MKALIKKLLAVLGVPLATILIMAANPAVLPQTIYVPGAATTTAGQFPVFDGGTGSLPPVQTFSLYAPAYFAQNGTVAPAGGFDGGLPVAFMFEPFTVTSATSPVIQNLASPFTQPPMCLCGVASGPGDTISKCAGAIDAGPQPNVVIATTTADGGTFTGVCFGN